MIAVRSTLILFYFLLANSAMGISNASISIVTFHDVESSDAQSFVIDTEKKICLQNGDSTPEPFVETTTMKFTVTNNLSVNTKLESFSFRVRIPGTGLIAKSKNIHFGQSIPAKGSANITLPFAIANNDDTRKVFAGTTKELESRGYHRIRLKLKFKDGRGARWNLSRKIGITLANVDRCEG